jgi:mannitol-specific phosphotransferase system IIBC component
MAAWTQFLSTAQLNQLVRRGEVRAEDIARIKHTRFTLPINNMVLLLLGMAFFMNRLPNSVLTQGAKALATCAISFLVAFAGQQMVGAFSGAYAGTLPAWVSILPAWVPLFLFGPLAVVLLDNVKT